MDAVILSRFWFLVLSAFVVVAIITLGSLDLVSRVVNLILRRRYPIYHISSNKYLPTLPFIFPNGQGNVEKFLNGRRKSVEWNLQYGSVYRIWSGSRGEVVLTEPNDIEIVFRDSHTHQKAPANDSGHLMNLLLGSCVGLVSGSEWQSLRRATEHSFLQLSAKSHITRVLLNAKNYISTLYQHQINTPIRTRTNEDVVEGICLHPVADLKNYPLLVVAEIIYGKLSNELKQKLMDLIPGRVRLFNQIIQGGITRFKISRLLPFRINREVDIFKRDWACWNDDAYTEALRRDHQTRNIDIVKPRPAVLDMYQSVEDGLTTREHLLQTLDEMLFANLDVTIGALSWPLVFLAAHPHTQDELRREILASESSNLESYMLSVDTYLHFIILEAARLRPLVAFSIPQSCPTQRIVGEYLIPAGTNFIVDAYALNIRNAVWGPDNTSFRPDRWGELYGKRKKVLRYCYWRFGFGPRLCMGKHVADVMIKALLIELVGQFDLSMNENIEWKWDEESWIHHPDLEIRCMKRQV